MKIIDWQKRGHVVRFYLGSDHLESWHGDDWNDAPWEHNAGRVYDEFVRGYVDAAFAFDAELHEPGDGVANSQWTKNDMVARSVPFLTYETPGRGVSELHLGDPVSDLDRLRWSECAR